MAVCLAVMWVAMMAFLLAAHWASATAAQTVILRADYSADRMAALWAVHLDEPMVVDWVEQ